MQSKEIRESFLKYFERHDHRVVASSSLIPIDDPTLLFTNAGMNQFKDIFTGKAKPSFKRAASSQKCMRVSGKHNDLEEVGISPYHHTFFEMLGNFSFGDYFKKEAVHYGWEYITKVLGLPREQLYVTVFTEDDEAFACWEKTDDFLKKSGRILRFGEKDNYWAMGDTGPNGPCSEIHFDRGGDFEGELNIFGDRFLELWNLVFMQYERDADGNASPLPKPSIDTGAGLERLTLILQDKKSNYDTDIFWPIIEKIVEISGREYISETSGKKGESGIPHRVIADHLRALAFGFSDGAYPSNEGRGYVLRRILRRASYHGRLLGVYEPFIYKLVPLLVVGMGDIYPELKEKEIHTTELIKSEEEAFGKTLDRGLEIFSDIVNRLKLKGQKVIPGKDAFKLYDTYGFPVDLTQIMAEKEGLSIDINGYNADLEKQRQRSREGVKTITADAEIGDEVSEFRGYDHESYDAKVLSVEKGDENIAVTLDATPFYAESGGQVGDRGCIIDKETGRRYDVIDTQKQGERIVHLIKPSDEFTLAPSKNVEAAIDSERRGHIKRNHTATHLLHRALHRIIGDHATQAGSYVGPDYLRFDFSHFKALTDDEITKIEADVNKAIRADYEVLPEQDIDLDSARAEGAMALFGEKYGEKVRVIRIKYPDGDNYSIELCGGTHVNRTGEIGLFVITSESAIAAGMRRIEALTGAGAYRYLKNRDRILEEIGSLLKSAPEEIVGRVESLLEKNKELIRGLDILRKDKASEDVGEWVEKAAEVNGSKVVAVDPGITDRAQMMNFADALREKLGSGIGILGSVIDNKAALVVVVTDDLIKSKKIKAGDIVKELAPLIDGAGGGRAHLAQAGGRSPGKLPGALKESIKIVENILK